LSELALREKIYFGGEKEREALYFSPTILRDISFHDKIMEDEIFGPLLPIVPYGDLDEALSGIKRLPKPLAFYLFTHDQKIKQKVLNTISFGGGCINDTVVHLANPHLPFGGVGNSGIGSYHGKKSFETFSHLKSIYEQTPMVDIPLRYPPYKGKLNWIKFFLR
jgi:aldehyde dehydrogenase (NAD+)